MQGTLSPPPVNRGQSRQVIYLSLSPSLPPIGTQIIIICGWSFPLISSWNSYETYSFEIWYKMCLEKSNQGYIQLNQPPAFLVIPGHTLKSWTRYKIFFPKVCDFNFFFKNMFSAALLLAICFASAFASYGHGGGHSSSHYKHDVSGRSQVVKPHHIYLYTPYRAMDTSLAMTSLIPMGQRIHATNRAMAMATRLVSIWLTLYWHFLPSARFIHHLWQGRP